MTLAEQLKLLMMLRAEKKNLTEEIEELETTIAENMEDKQMVIEGIGLVQRRQKGARTKWDHEAVFSAVKRYAAAYDDGTPMDGIELVQKLANPSWRTTKLREIDIDPDEYSVKTPGGYTVLIEWGVVA